MAMRRSQAPRDPAVHKCLLCHRYHSIRFCKTFLAMRPAERGIVARRFEYCLNCFARTHNVYSCDSPDTCMYCGQLHHTLLHDRRRKRDRAPRRSVHDRLGPSRQDRHTERARHVSNSREDRHAVLPCQNKNGRQRSISRRSSQRNRPNLNRINSNNRHRNNSNPLPMSHSRNRSSRRNNTNNTHRLQPNQLILSEAIRSLTDVLCATTSQH